MVALQVLSKYTLMIVRMKLSYEAFLRKSTIIELIVRQIATSFHFLKYSGQIKGISCANSHLDYELLQQIYKENAVCCLKMVIKHNLLR